MPHVQDGHPQALRNARRGGRRGRTRLLQRGGEETAAAAQAAAAAAGRRFNRTTFGLKICALGCVNSQSQDKTQVVFQAKVRAKMFLLNWAPSAQPSVGAGARGTGRAAAGGGGGRRSRGHRRQPRLMMVQIWLRFRSAVQICQKSRRVGCVIPHCNLQRGITQPTPRLF